MDKVIERKTKQIMSGKFIKFINENPEKPCDWYGISYNPTITWDIIEANPDKPWDWYSISRNPTITWDMIEANPDDPWDWECISYNRFSKQHTQIYNKIFDEYKQNHKTHFMEKVRYELLMVAMHPSRYAQII